MDTTPLRLMSFAVCAFFASAGWAAPRGKPVDGEKSKEVRDRPGWNALPFAIQRLADPRLANLRGSLAAQLAATSKGDDSRAAVAFDKYARQTLALEPRPPEADEDICVSLEAIGRRGGPTGVEMLRRWLWNNNIPEQGRIVRKVTDEHLRCAIRGLGLNSHPYAKLDLQHLLERPPKSDNPGVIEKALREALAQKR